jgi:hypothetical protein
MKLKYHWPVIDAVEDPSSLSFHKGGLTENLDWQATVFPKSLSSEFT